MGGENDFDIVALFDVLGSSPRGRGKRPAIEAAFTPRRLIPAWAGKTRPQFRLAPTRQAHPRVGGENSKTGAVEIATSGSSPRGRGKLWETEAESVAYGLIPAWAGKTTPISSFVLPARAHPRVGGENYPPNVLMGVERGSSPRGRGKLGVVLRQAALPGLNPAWAGKTL